MENSYRFLHLFFKKEIIFYKKWQKHRFLWQKQEQNNTLSRKVELKQNKNLHKKSHSLGRKWLFYFYVLTYFKIRFFRGISLPRIAQNLSVQRY